MESGGVEALPKQLRGTDLSTAQKAWRWLISAVSEGGEEPVQGLISEMTAKAAYAANKPYFSITDENAVINPRRMSREFGYGTAIGGITGAVPMASAKAMELWTRAPRESGGRTLLQNTTEVQQNKTAPGGETGTESTAVNTNPANHTVVEQRIIDEYQNSVDENLVKFAEEVLRKDNQNGTQKRRYELKPVSDRAAADILREIGVDATGFQTAIEGRIIEHIEKKTRNWRRCKSKYARLKRSGAHSICFRQL